MGEIRIRRYRREEDFNAVLDLYMRAYRGMEEYGESSRKAAKRYIRWLERHCDEDTFVAVDGERIVGAVFVDRDWHSLWEGDVVVAIHEIFVDPDYYGRGIGHMLMRKAESLAPPGSTIELWVGERNEKARRFYESLGYTRAGQWKVWIRMVKRQHGGTI
jgi:GNAT superfamily N-acetyltransferase